MKTVARLLSFLGLTVAVALATPLTAHADVGVSVYGSGRHHGYALSWRDDGHRHRGYRDSRYAPRYAPRYRYGTYVHPRSYYGFDGGYYGVYDGGSYEVVFRRGYDEGYNDGLRHAGRISGGSRAYRRGYDEGYRDGARDRRYR